MKNHYPNQKKKKPIFRLYDSITGQDVLIATARNIWQLNFYAAAYAKSCSDEWQPYLTLDGKPVDYWNLKNI